MARKNITLPSGSTCVVSKLTRYDFIGSNRIPVAFPMENGKPKVAEDNPATSEFYLSLARVAIVRHCGRIVARDGAVTMIVDKPEVLCGAGEVSWEQVEPEDADAIINAVMELSGMTQEAGREAAPFPAGQAAAPAP
jgi:hypothetical protein